MNQQSHWAGIVAAVKNPLGFFSLALLVTMTGLTIVGTCSGMEAWQQFTCFCIMAVLLLTVVIIVARLVVRVPKHLYESVAESEKLVELFNSPGFADVVRPVVYRAMEKRLKPDCFVGSEDKPNGESDG